MDNNNTARGHPKPNKALGMRVFGIRKSIARPSREVLHPLFTALVRHI